MTDYYNNYPDDYKTWKNFVKLKEGEGPKMMSHF